MRFGWLALPALWLLGGCGSSTPATPPPAQAWTDDGYITNGPYTLSYQAQALQDVNPEVANRYGLRPRTGRGLLTLVLNRQPGAVPVEATFSAEVRTLTGELREAPLRRVEDAGAVSLLAEFTTTRREWLVFRVTAEVPGGPRLETTFRREFFGD